MNIAFTTMKVPSLSTDGDFDIIRGKERKDDPRECLIQKVVEVINRQGHEQDETSSCDWTFVCHNGTAYQE